MVCMKKISDFDKQVLNKIRENIDLFVKTCSQKYELPGAAMLDIAPQDHKGANPFFTKSQISTLDINPHANPTYLQDLCADMLKVPTDKFDYILCTEVLEHTLQPFIAVENIAKLLKVGGLVFVSTPFNFRIHGPLPDCWRFTEHGLRALFTKHFEILELNTLEDKSRFLMPLQYTLVAKKR